MNWVRVIHVRMLARQVTSGLRGRQLGQNRVQRLTSQAATRPHARAMSTRRLASPGQPQQPCSKPEVVRIAGVAASPRQSNSATTA